MHLYSFSWIVLQRSSHSKSNSSQLHQSINGSVLFICLHQHQIYILANSWHYLGLQVKAFLADPSAFAVAAAPEAGGGTTETAKDEPKKEEEEEEEEEDEVSHWSSPSAI